MNKVWKKFVLILTFFLLITSCVSGYAGRSDYPETDENSESSIVTLEISGTKTSENIAEVVSGIEEITNARIQSNLLLISPMTVNDLKELAVVMPYFPPYYLISPDGRIGAIGKLDRVDVVNLSTGDLVDSIPIELPISSFGIERFFQFNYDGSFIAIAAADKIQVWQVGNGLIYNAPLLRQYATDENIVGAEIPQLALSPDGTLLAVSAVDFSLPSQGQYFKVVDILENRVIYEWNGTSDALHGSFYNYPGLGFTPDGSMLQTFDASKFRAFNGTAFEAFRFWSAENWQELDPLSKQVKNDFPKDHLLFALQSNDVVEILDRTNGFVRGRLAGTGCTLDYPCAIELSSNGKYAAVVDYSETAIQYHRDLIAQEFEIWDLEKGEKTGNLPFTARNLDGVKILDNGGYLEVAQQLDEIPTTNSWWTSAFNFMGIANQGDNVFFTPQRLNTFVDSSCYFCGFCELDLNDFGVNCIEGFNSEKGYSYQLFRESGQGIVRKAGGSKLEVGAIDLSAYDKENWSERILGYSEKHAKLFYCMDENQRQQECFISDLENEQNKNIIEDIFALRFSPQGDHAVFINREEKSLFSTDLQTGKSVKISAYQSRAWPANPSFGNNGSELVYVIQNINAADILSLEWVDVQSGNVLRRFNLDSTIIPQPSVLAWSEESGLVALGGENGWIYLLDQKNGKLVHSWQAQNDAVIGITFAWEGKLLITMGQNGVVRIWGAD